MRVLDIIIVGLIATTYMSLVHLLADRTLIGTRDFLRALGTFMIPEPLRSRGMSLSLHFLAGIFLTAAYGFVFDFIKPEALANFIETGVLIGLAHGFFLGVFFYGLDPVKGPARFRPGAALNNVLSQVVFGVAVGLGLGVTQHTGTVAWFALYGVLGFVTIIGLLLLLGVPRRRRRPHAARA